MKISKVGICLKPGQSDGAGLIGGLRTWLREKNVQVFCDEEAAACVGEAGLGREALAEKVDLIIALGGDGTVLGVARTVGSRGVPIFGVNLGRLGFLAEIAREELFPALEKVFSDKMVIESRMRLALRVERAGQVLGEYLALNDAVISYAGTARLIELEAWLDGARVTTYYADGLIVATPTGSTGYSLSAGGPILMPQLEAFMLTPICPHTLSQRPIVVPQSSQLEVCVRGSHVSVELTVDGQVSLPLKQGDRMSVSRAMFPALFVASPLVDRFEILRKKLHWGGR